MTWQGDDEVVRVFYADGCWDEFAVWIAVADCVCGAPEVSVVCESNEEWYSWSLRGAPVGTVLRELRGVNPGLA